MTDNSLLPASDAAQKCGRVAVLMGGMSAEREVSLRSGQAVFNALLDAGVDAIAVDVQQNMIKTLSELQVDRVFNILHGRGGEGGQVQALLSLLEIPFTGSGVTASAVTLDKIINQRLLRGSDIPVPEFIEMLGIEDCEKVIEMLGLPVFVKPTREGSSLGMSPVNKAEELPAAWKKASEYGAVFAEKMIVGAEYTAGYLDRTVLPLIRLETPHEFYDYDAKYEAEDTRYSCPCGLDKSQIEDINQIVLKTIQVTGVRHWGRVDLMMDEQNKFWVIDVNTAPGMTDHSLVPMAAKAVGLSFSQLCLKILSLTL